MCGGSEGTSASERERQGDLLLFRATERDDGDAAALARTRRRRGCCRIPCPSRTSRAGSRERDHVEQRGDVQRLVAARRLDPPRERQAGARCRHASVQLVPVEAACPCACETAERCPQRRIRVAVPLALRAAVARRTAGRWRRRACRRRRSPRPCQNPGTAPAGLRRTRRCNPQARAGSRGASTEKR